MTAKKKVFSTILNYDHTKQTATVFTKPSLTIPDHSLTIPEMLKRFASGRPVNVKVYDDYGGDDDHLTGVDLRTLDISEIHDLMEQSTDNLRKLKIEADIRRKKFQDEQLEKSIIEKYEARRALERENRSEDDRPRFIQTEAFPDDRKKQE